ncbi:MAG: DUF4286 family protein [Bacteroidetes bacterium]|nr:DUF4286 family protein [Bacteroidota bacterium]
MYIYNVTLNMDAAIAEEWLHWMKTQHVPDVLKTGCFVGNQIVKILGNDEGATYSVQYTFKTMEDYDRYKAEHAPALQKEHTEKFSGKFAAFRTLLQIV